MNTFKIKKGDTVRIISGKDKGKTGKVLRCFFTRDRVSIEGINIYKKHVRPKKQNEKGQIVEVARPLHISNVQIVCPSCGANSRIAIQRDKNSRSRACKKCNATF